MSPRPVRLSKPTREVAPWVRLVREEGLAPPARERIMNWKQKLFNRSYRGLRKQGFQRCAEVGGSCNYRGAGPTEGWKCAVGHLFPDSLYDPDWDAGSSSSPDILSAVRCANKITESEIDDVDFQRFLFRELQKAHDESHNPISMETNLRFLAERHDLTVPS